jgi:glucose/arabinose dehydrogenase
MEAHPSHGARVSRAAMSLPSFRRLIATSMIAVCATAGIALLAPGSASALSLVPIGSFDQPVHVDNAPGKKNRKLLFVVEKPGRIVVLRGDQALPFLDLTDLVLGPSGTEQGLLSIAFHPRYERNRLFYVYLTNKAGDNAVYEFKRARKSRVRALRASGRLVLLIPHPDDATNHNGGQLQFGPDRLLYIAPGDGGSTPEAAQDLNNLNGKVLRLDPVRSCAKRKKRGKRTVCLGQTKPYTPKGALSKSSPVYSLGLRNHWRFSFDAATGAIVIGDVGSGAREEVDYLPRGGAARVNFGWPRFEGTVLGNPSIQAPGAIPPIFDYSTAAGSNCAITGGYVIRDSRLGSLQGRYVYADFCGGDIRTLVPSAGGASGDSSTGLPTVPSLSSFGEGRRNVLFVASLDGPVYRLDP